jgi:PAS domain S-box-containing protein
MQNEELQAQSEELQVQNEELQAQSEELQVQNEELQAQSEELNVAYKLLRETEERFRTLTENSPDMIVRFDRQNRQTYANPAAVKFFGCHQEEIMGKTNTKLGMDSELIQFWEEHYENVFITEKQDAMEFNYKSSQGKDYYFNMRIVPEFIKNEVTSVLTISRDITNIKKVEEALRLSNIYNRSLIEASLDLLVTIGLDGKITDVNIATEQVTGYPRNELIGTDFSDYFTEPRAASIGYQQVFRHGEVRDYSLEIQYKDGHITPVLYNASVYKNESGKVIGIFAAARDITERKRMEIELESLSRLPRETPNPVIRLNQGRKINYSNPAAQMLLIDWGCATSQEVPAAITELAIAALADGNQRKFEYNYANNTYIINLTPFSQSGYVNLYVRDITEYKKAEEALQNSENKYRTLFESIDEGFCIIEMIFDANGKPADYRFLETNPAFEKQTGLREATRETMRESVPNHEEHWFEIYGTIALTGEPKRFINEAKALTGGWYEVYAFKVGT